MEHLECMLNHCEGIYEGPPFSLLGASPPLSPSWAAPCAMIVQWMERAASRRAANAAEARSVSAHENRRWYGTWLFTIIFLIRTHYFDLFWGTHIAIFGVSREFCQKWIKLGIYQSAMFNFQRADWDERPETGREHQKHAIHEKTRQTACVIFKKTRFHSGSQINVYTQLLKQSVLQYSFVTLLMLSSIGHTNSSLCR